MIKKILILKIFIHVTSPLGRGAWKTSFYKPDTIPNSIKLLEVIYQVVRKLFINFYPLLHKTQKISHDGA